MCGIATISVGRGRRGRIPYPKLRGLTQEILVELASRGQDASGIAVVNDDECFVFKKPLRPSRLVVRPRFREILNKIGPQTNFIMLHSRSASVGGNEDNYNNHPIIADPVVGIHNGTLYNSQELFKKHSRDFSPEGSVDSEVIFRLFHMYKERGLSPDKAMKRVAHKLDGAFTGAVVDLRKTSQMLMFKYERPLSLLRLEHYDMLIALSEVSHFDRARSRMKLKMKDSLAHPKEETGFLVDVNAGPITGKLTDFELPISDEFRYSARGRWHNQWAYFG
jgi:glucosamine 6-phosphate synthetase-like amidotransferase/phosphosugar isomerase protein